MVRSAGCVRLRGPRARIAAGRCGTPRRSRRRRLRSPPRGRRAAGATSRAPGARPATRCATATASSVTSGSSWPASAASVSGSGAPCIDDAQTTLGDARPHVDGKVERCRAHLLEPEAELLDEVEREAVAPRRAGRDDDDLELDDLARLDRVRERRAGPVPHDRVAERIEPVVRELHAFPPARAPRCRARVLEPHPSYSRDACARLAPARTRASEPRAAPRGRGARRRAPLARAQDRNPLKRGFRSREDP